MSTITPLLQVSEEEARLVRLTTHLEDIRRDVDMVMEWFERQPHLPRSPLDRDMIERLLISSKGSVEQTKHHLEMIFSARTLIPELASRDILDPEIDAQFHAMKYAMCPKLNCDLTRVHLFKFAPVSAELYNLTTSIRIIFIMIEHRLKSDYALGDRYVFDFADMTLAHAAKLHPIGFRNGDVLMKAYGRRVFGIHLLNCPSFVGLVLNILKSAMSEKISKRIVSHADYEDLYKSIDKTILPMEYGGDEASMDILSHRWQSELGKPEIHQYLLQQEKLKSDEELRLVSRPTDDMLGIPGSFRSIDID